MNLHSNVSYKMYIHFVTAVYRLLALLEFFLILRLTLLLLGASSASSVVRLYYQFTDLFVDPFKYGFNNIPLGLGYVLDSSTLFAMVGYAIGLYVTIQIIDIFYHHQ